MRKPPVKDGIARVQEGIQRKGWPADVVLGGSVAKNTALRGSHDVDLFVRFDPSFVSQEKVSLSDLLEQVVPPGAKRVHGSRDYFVWKHKGFTFEIVPVLRVSHWREAQNVTDLSPLHVAYVKGHLEKRPFLADEIRLAKRWCQAQRVYGAESYISGLSGHVLDVLIIHYGSFLAFLRAASAWEPPVVIDVEGHGTAVGLNQAKKHSPLIVIDPLQPDRNAAAALSPQVFQKIKKAAAAFIARPSQRAFTIVHLTPSRIWKRHPDALVVELVGKDEKEDVAGAKCRKVYEFLTRQLRLHGFRVVETDWEFRFPRAVLFWVVAPRRLGRVMTVQGPPVSQEAAALKFQAKHKDVFRVGRRWFAREPRVFTTPRQLIASLVGAEEVAGRVAAARVVRRPRRS